MADDARKVSGRSFQSSSPETAKRRDPYVVIFILGTIRSPRAAEHMKLMFKAHLDACNIFKIIFEPKGFI